MRGVLLFPHRLTNSVISHIEVKIIELFAKESATFRFI